MKESLKTFAKTVWKKANEEVLVLETIGKICLIFTDKKPKEPVKLTFLDCPKGFENTKIAKDNCPLMVYRGLRNSGNNNNDILTERYTGIYFTPNPMIAISYSDKFAKRSMSNSSVLCVYLDVKNPYIHKSFEFINENGKQICTIYCITNEAKNALLKAGYDCWQEDESENTEIVIFDRSQIFVANAVDPQTLLDYQEQENSIHWQTSLAELDLLK